MISRSSIEAKFRSLANIVVEITWLCSLLGELRITVSKPFVVWCDNLNIILWAANPVLHAPRKSTLNWIYVLLEKRCCRKRFSLNVPSLDQTVDIFTKPISSYRIFPPSLDYKIHPI